jgi:hypothetical protein
VYYAISRQTIKDQVIRQLQELTQIWKKLPIGNPEHSSRIKHRCRNCDIDFDQSMKSLYQHGTKNP